MLYTFRLLIVLVSVVVLQGCDKRPAETMMERYSNRVANSLDSEAELDLNVPLAIPSYPRRRERLRTVTDLRQGMIEVLNLRHCQLINLIAERNSSMGKVMPPSRQLIYEIRLLSRLNSCLNKLKQHPTDQELVAQVKAIYRTKADDFEAAIWNGIFTSEAIERNFSLSEPALSATEDNGFSQSRQALLILNKIASLISKTNSDRLTWSEPEYLDQLEPHYQALSSLRYGSRWLRSVYLITYTLNHTAQVIEQRLKQRPLCYNQQATPKARIVKNVFTKYYAGEFQPYLARIDRQGREWLKLNRQLLQNFKQLPKPMQQFQAQVLADDAPLWQNYLKARDHHTKTWQKLLAQCNLMPGS